MYNKMDNSVFEEYVKWSRTKDLTSFAEVFKAGWEASEGLQERRSKPGTVRPTATSLQWLKSTLT